MRIKVKNITLLAVYIVGIILLVLVAMIISKSVVPNQDYTSNNLILERTKLIVSILGPILTFVVFIRTIQTQLESSKNLIKDSVSKDFYNLLNLFIKIQGKIDKSDYEKLESNIKNKISMITKNLGYRNSENSESIEKDLIDEHASDFNTELNEYIKTINNYFVGEYDKFGSYLKVFHRIVKLLNSKYESNEISYQDYRMYVGILRSQLENYEFYIIFINSLFTNRGIGMGVELLKTSFFGDELDIELNQHFDHPYFLTNVINEYFIEDNKKFKSVKMRKKVRKKYKKRSKEDNLLSLLKVVYKLSEGNEIQISYGIKP